MKVIGLLSRKGGVGKTTLAVHLAVLAQQAGRQTLLIDLDPQRSASAGGGRERPIRRSCLRPARIGLANAGGGRQ